MKTGNNKKLLGIQYLRGIAVVLVVLFHITGMARFEKYFDRNLLDGFFSPGAVGVELFFVISGFIIAHVSLNSFDFKPKISTRDFFSRRFTRIIPFMWACVLAYAALRFLGRGTFPFLPYLRSLVLFPIGNLQPNQIWTLRHEFLFYIIFGISIIQLRSKWIYIIIWFISPIIWFGFKIDELFIESDFKQLFNFIFSKLNILFGIGCLISFLYRRNILKFKFATNHGMFFCILATSILFYFAGSVEIGETNVNFLQVLVSGIISFGIIAFSLSIYTESPLSYLDKLGLILGDASYSIYLTHSAIISSILGPWSRFQPNVNSAIVLIIITILCCLVGILVHIYIENPLIELFHKKAKFNKVKVTANYNESNPIL